MPCPQLHHQPIFMASFPTHSWGCTHSAFPKCLKQQTNSHLCTQLSHTVMLCGYKVPTPALEQPQASNPKLPSHPTTLVFSSAEALVLLSQRGLEVGFLKRGLTGSLSL